MSPGTHPRQVLAVDVGNSRVKVGLFENLALPSSGSLPTALHSLTMSHSEPIPWDQITQWCAAHSWSSVSTIIAGTHPSRTSEICKTWPEALNRPIILSSPDEVSVKNLTDHPEKTGIDRLLNAVAANHLRPSQLTAIIIDSGTATTVDVISSTGAFCGGAILPGFELSAISLHRYTEQLPLLTIEELANNAGGSALGNNTRAALKSGILWGQIGAVRELITRLQHEISGESVIYISGGGASLLMPHFLSAVHLPHLSLQGLALLVK